MKNQYKITIIFSLIIFGLCGCAFNGQGLVNKPFNPGKSMVEAYAKVTPGDGIDKKEAFILAEAYFEAYISGDGVVSNDPIDLENKWEIEVYLGVVPMPYDSIFINKRTGVITCAKGPTIRVPDKFNRKIEYTCIGDAGSLYSFKADLIIETEIISINNDQKDCPYSIVVKTKVLKVKKGRWDYEFFYLPVHRCTLGPSFKVGAKKELRAVIDKINQSYVVKDKEIITEAMTGQYEPDCSLWHYKDKK